MDRIKLEPSWKLALKSEFSKPYMVSLRQFLTSELSKKKKIFPPPKDFFAAFDYTPVDQVKVVILGQDPYHGAGQAHGLCFSVQDQVRFPPSLENIFKELKSDLNISRPQSGNLSGWAKQGVLLLNATLSVEEDKAGSHQKKGWEEFTDRAIQYLNEHREHIVFILWGSYAQKKGEFIDRNKHCVLTAPHPSPLSSHRGFFGSKPFSKTNEYLKKTNQRPICWEQIND